MGVGVAKMGVVAPFEGNQIAWELFSRTLVVVLGWIQEEHFSGVESCDLSSILLNDFFYWCSVFHVMFDCFGCFFLLTSFYPVVLS